MIRYIVLSDIHLGDNKNTTGNIINNLLLYFKENHKLFSKLDIIIVAGDIFHKLLMTNSDDYKLAMNWLLMLSSYCNTHKIKLRILEGTKSHDWGQGNILETINKYNMGDIDFKYIDTLHIENMHDIGLSILYVPDEYKHKASDTYTEVKALLKDNNMDKVDIAVMHGQFHYQLPMVKLESSHEEDLYHEIVKYYISVGHIHTHSVNNRILAQGSFDRLTHGQEEPKGAIYISINNITEEAEWRFIENKNALTFKTLRYLDNDEIDMDKLDKDIKSLKPGSYVRIIVNVDNPVLGNKKDIRKRYLGYNIDIETERQIKDTDSYIDILDMPHIDSFHITKDTIVELMDIEMSKYNFTTIENNIYRKELSNTI